MTREDIIRMARESGIYRPYWEDGEDPNKDPPRWVTVGPIPPLLERFAAFVAAAEREACAKVCDAIAMHCEAKAQEAIECGEHDEVSAIRSTAWQISVCAAAIRARSEK